MRSFTRGERAKISDLSSRTRRFEVTLTFCCGPIPVFDFVCFGTDAKNQLSDDRYMIFFNQRRAPDGSIVLDELQDQDARFSVDLDAVPPHIERLTFTASPEAGGCMNQLGVSFLSLRKADVAGVDTIATYRFSGHDFGEEGSLLVGEIYKKGGEWRFGAIGQGFAGNLPALLKHFGGEASEENAASSSVSPPTAAPTAPIIPPRQPSPPVSSPTPISVAAPAASATSAFHPHNALQKIIDDAPSGSTLQLARGEFAGPIIVNKPLVIEGNGAVIWAHNGPVVRVSSAGVTLRDLEVEVTAPGAGPDLRVALWVENGTNAALQKVRVRGEIVGVAAALGEWKLPPQLDLGEFAARELNSFEFEIEVPHSCELQTNVSGVSFVSPRVEAGARRVEMRVNGVGNDTFLAGHIELSSGGIGRTVPLRGRCTTGAPAARGVWLWRLANGVDTPSNPA